MVAKVNEQEYLQQLETLVNIESGSFEVAGLKKVADTLQRWYEELGWHTRRYPLDERTGDVLVCCNREAEHYDVMFAGHMDTVFPTGSILQHPFSVDGDIIHGLGACDMKGGDVAMYQVAKLLAPEVLEKLNICMVYNPDEEIGSPYSKALMDELAQRCEHVLVMEGASDGNVHCTGRKGMVNYTLAFQGKAGHAGYMLQRDCASAVLELGHYIVKLMALANKEKDTSVNVGVVSGGTATNVVAESAQLSLESRFWSDEERDRIVNAIEQMVAAQPHVPGVQVTVVSSRSVEPWPKTQAMADFANDIRKIAEERGIAFAEEVRGGLSDGNHIGRHCAKCIDGMGPAGGGNTHSLDEWAQLHTIHDCVELICAVLEDMAQKKSI